MQYGPMLMNVQPGDTDAKLSRYEAFDDNMEVVLELVNKIHNRTFKIFEFELVTSNCFLLHFIKHKGKFKIMNHSVTSQKTVNM